MNYLQIKNLKNKFGVFSLGPINFAMDKGQYYVLAGAIGSGKTSFLKSIVFYNKDLEGNVFLNGDDILKLPTHKRGIGYVAQKSNLFPHLTVKENIAFGLKYLNLSTNERKKKLEEFVELFGLSEILNTKACNVSGGESKITAIARSLIIDPKILLLDEPLSMLDVESKNKVVNILELIHKKIGATTIHVTHDIGEAEGLYDKCLRMDAGALI